MERRVKHARKRGFTLIELLVVIAIIAILAAVLFPVFSHARDKARQSSCVSNEKQIGLAILQYVQDFDEKYPYNDFWDGTTDRSWRVVVFPYMKSEEVLQCPSNDTSSELDVFDTYHRGYAVNGFHLSSYLANQPVGTANLVPLATWWSGAPVTSLSGIPTPSSLVVITETTAQWPDSAFDAGSACSVQPPTDPAQCFIPPALFLGHQGRGNFGFADGHVKAMKVTQTMTPVNLWDTADIENKVPAPPAALTQAGLVQAYWDIQ